MSYGIPEYGYAWLSPKAETASIGMGTFLPRRKAFSSEFSQFTASLGVELKDQSCMPTLSP